MRKAFKTKPNMESKCVNWLYVVAAVTVAFSILSKGKQKLKLEQTLSK